MSDHSGETCGNPTPAAGHLRQLWQLSLIIADYTSESDKACILIWINFCVVFLEVLTIAADWSALCIKEEFDYIYQRTES